MSNLETIAKIDSQLKKLKSQAQVFSEQQAELLIQRSQIAAEVAREKGLAQKGSMGV